MPHIIKPLLVVGVLRRASTSKIINCSLVCIGVEYVDVPKPSTHVDGAVSCTSICALRLIAVSLGSGVGTYTLRAVLKACVIVTSRRTVSHAPKIFSVKPPNKLNTFPFLNLTLRSVVLEVVVSALKEHPVQIVEGVLEATDVGES